MAVAIMGIGVGAGISTSALLWASGASLIVVALAYPVAGAVGCLVAGAGLALCRGRHDAACD